MMMSDDPKKTPSDPSSESTEAPAVVTPPAPPVLGAAADGEFGERGVTPRPMDASVPQATNTKKARPVGPEGDPPRVM